MNSERYAANLKRWKLFCPQAAEQLEAMRRYEGMLNVIEGNSGPVNLETYVDGQAYPFHSLEAPDEEAAEWVKKIDLESCDVLYVYGVGLAYIFDALKEWLENPKNLLVFMEDQLPVIAALFNTERGARLLSHPRVWLYYLESGHKSLNEFVDMFLAERPCVIALPLYERLYGRQVHELRVKITFLRNLQYPHLVEYRNFGLGFFNNYFHNLFSWPNAYLGDGLFDKFPMVPAIICGAGPSLSKNIDLLGKLSNRALIFAGGTAMNAVNAKNILPHFGVGIDPNFEQSTRIIMNKAFDTPFFYRSRINYGALEMVKGDRLYLSGTSGYDVAGYFEKEVGISPTSLEEGCNVINMSLAIAALMGCNPIILVGVDLSYTIGSLSYAEGVTSHPIHVDKHFFRTKEQSEELVSYTDINGNKVFTLWKWISESLWFSNFAAMRPQLKLINATEGGIGFNGIPNLTLEQVAAEFLTQEYDFHARVFGEIQNHPMPPSATPQFILNAIKTLAKSLERCALMVNEKWESLVKQRPQDSNVNNPDALLNEPSQHGGSALEDEIGFRYVLKKQGEGYDHLMRRQTFRLKNNLDGYSEDELIDRRREAEIQRLAYLRQGAIAVRDLIEGVLERHQDISLTPEAGPASRDQSAEAQQVDDAIYSFEDGKYTLVDKEFGLRHVEQFVLDVDIVRERLYTDEGHLQYECCKRAGKLHGPSSFYGHDKQLLARCWYIDGLLQGKMLQYFASGALYGIQRYRDGLRHGLQERFYHNGFLRSSLPYQHGLLHGELIMVHENGQQARSLTFIEGKRSGIERIWDEKGQLIIEAEYQDDLPVGAARVWHDNGVLAQESFYGNPGEVLQTRRWDAAGVLLDESQYKHLDYFEEIAKQTGVLTDSLAGIVQSVALVAPLANRATGQKGAPEHATGYEKELNMINRELEKLRELQEKMMFESGLNQKNPLEAIWKTPSIKRELQQQLDTMTKELQEGVAKMQATFGKTLEDLEKKEKEKEKGSGKDKESNHTPNSP